MNREAPESLDKETLIGLVLVQAQTISAGRILLVYHLATTIELKTAGKPRISSETEDLRL